jgi:hypothetical protein
MRLVLHAALAAAAFSILSWANPAAAASDTKPLFASDEILHLTLKGPIVGIPRGKGAAPVPGVLTVAGPTPETLPVQLSVRGITRRLKQICAFPQLRVEFTEKPAKTSVFRGQDSLKLVTHCQSAKNYQQNLLLEYASYRLYRALTPDSFNVRLAQVDYVGADGDPIISRLGFFIEDVSDVAKRNGHARLRGVKSISASQLDPAAATRFALFEYMISNLDWSMTASPPGEDCCHNSRLVGAKEATTELVPLPYDFDYSGLVNAPYAVPPDGIRASSVRQRIYRGFCLHNTQAQAFAADMAARRGSLIAIVDQTPQLEESTRTRADSYLGEFFDEVGSPAKVAELLKVCLR